MTLPACPNPVSIKLVPGKKRLDDFLGDVQGYGVFGIPHLVQFGGCWLFQISCVSFKTSSISR